jgi:hypothetical protein
MLLWAPGSGRSRHFVHWGMRDLFLELLNHDGKEGEKPNHAPGVLFRWTVLITSARMWAQFLNALAASRLPNPNINTLGLLATRSRGSVPPVFYPSALLWPLLPPAIGISLFITSRSPCSNSQDFSCEALIHDPTCGSNEYSPSHFSRPRDLGCPMFGLSPCELLSS